MKLKGQALELNPLFIRRKGWKNYFIIREGNQGNMRDGVCQDYTFE